MSFFFLICPFKKKRPKHIKTITRKGKRKEERKRRNSRRVRTIKQNTKNLPLRPNPLPSDLLGIKKKKDLKPYNAMVT